MSYFLKDCIEGPPPETEEEKANRLAEVREKRQQELLLKTITRQIKAKKNDENKTTFTREKSKKAKLNKFLQAESDIYDKATELYIKDKFTLFKYQSFNPLLVKREDAKSEDGESDSESETYKEQVVDKIEPDERSKLIKTDFEYPESDGQAF